MLEKPRQLEFIEQNAEEKELHTEELQHSAASSPQVLSLVMVSSQCACEENTDEDDGGGGAAPPKRSKERKY